MLDSLRDSEPIVQHLVACVRMARREARGVLRGGGGKSAPAGEHESSRRLKTEILTQMEGVDAATAERRIVLVAATNRPEAAPRAAVRRPPALQTLVHLRNMRPRPALRHADVRVAAAVQIALYSGPFAALYSRRVQLAAQRLPAVPAESCMCGINSKKMRLCVSTSMHTIN